MNFFKDLLGICDLRPDIIMTDIYLHAGGYVVIPYWSSYDVAKIQIVKKDYCQVIVCPLRGGKRLDPKIFPLLDSNVVHVKKEEIIRNATMEEIMQVSKYYAFVQ